MRPRSRFSAVLPALALLAALAPLGETCRAAGRNVVLVVADDLGCDLGCYGNSDVRTPALDALAAASTRFEQAFCTTSSCSPSRSVILTGLYNHANGQYGLAHADHHFASHARTESLPVLLAEAGYRTCSIGKHHVEPAELYRFETFANEGTQGHRNAIQMAENARAFIERDDPRPFFVYLSFVDAHRARQGFANGGEYPGHTPVVYDPEAIRPLPFLRDRPEVRADVADYYQSISRLDQGIARLVDVLHQTGHWDDTLLVFLSDNGSPFPGAKTTLYEPGVRLPLLIRRPGQQAPVVSRALVTWADLTPTILEFAAAAGPKYPLHGRSLWPILGEAEPAGWDKVYLSHTFHEVTMYYPMRAVRTRRHKLIWNLAHPLPYPVAEDLFHSPSYQSGLSARDQGGWFAGRSRAQFEQRPMLELYDLQRDPQEACNLAGDPDWASLRDELWADLRAWQIATRDPWRIKQVHE